MVRNIVSNSKAIFSAMDHLIRTGTNGGSIYRVTEKTVQEAAEIIKAGSVIAVPTDTIYGLAADAQNSSAIEKLYDIKKRNSEKPLAIAVTDVVDIKLWSYVDEKTESVLCDLLPGPVTVILNRRPVLNASLNPGTSKVAIRIPDNQFMRTLCSLVKSPIALTSANRSGGRSCVSIEEFKYLWPSLAAVFDAGALGDSRSGSTIIDLTSSGEYAVNRIGNGFENVRSTLFKHGLREC